MNLNEDLTPKSLSPVDGFRPYRKESYMRSVYPIVSKIHKECDFERIYIKKFLSEYEIVTKQIQELFDKRNPGDILEGF